MEIIWKCTIVLNNKIICGDNMLWIKYHRQSRSYNPQRKYNTSLTEVLSLMTL